MLANTDNAQARKVVAVTGGSDGLGKAIVRAFCQQGATVVMLARNHQRLQAAAEELNRADLQVVPIVADVTKDKSVENAVHQIASQFGRLDVWVNNVGKSTRASLADCSVETYNDFMQLNFYSAVRCTKLVLPMLEESSGCLINIGSLASKTAWPWMAPYSASKHALAAFTHQLRLEGPDNVNFLHVLPGPIKRPDSGLRYGVEATELPESVKLAGAGARLHGIDPDKIAAKIVQAEKRRKSELVMPEKSRLLFAIAQLSPSVGDWLLKKFMPKNS